MNILSIAKSLLRLKTQRADRLFTYPRKDQEKFLKKIYDKYLSEYDGKDSFDEYEARSFCQFLAQKELDGKFISLITEFASFFIYPILKYKYAQNYKRRKANNIKEKISAGDYLKEKSVSMSENDFAIYLVYDADRSNFPHDLNTKYNHEYYNNYNYSELNDDDIKFLAEINRKHLFNYSYKLKILIKVAIYRAMIEAYEKNKIDAVIVCSEYSYTSSILTYYLKKKNIKHIDIMHGEKLYYMRDSFCLFSELWVWDEHYKNLFESLYVPSFSIKVHNMTEFKWQNSKLIQTDDIQNQKTDKFEYCYYLANETREELEQVKQSLDKLVENSSKKYKIRLHPRYTDKEAVNSIFASENIESEGMGILDSLRSCDMVISLYSTVLYQAYELGKDLIVDDIKNPGYFNILHDLSYIIFSKKHYLLSDLINDNKA